MMGTIELLLTAAFSLPLTSWPNAPLVYVSAQDLTDPQQIQTRVLRNGQVVMSTQVRLACRSALLKAPALLAFDPDTKRCRGVDASPIRTDTALAVVEPPPLTPVHVVPTGAPDIFDDSFETPAAR